mmetsp:Transcript_120009/g.311522  ORF Transcript_120009/g.311522 Transcript_120009/m.311522 type:complete len:347 (-) Transcript_120009:79-1119(-)
MAKRGSQAAVCQQFLQLAELGVDHGAGGVQVALHMRDAILNCRQTRLDLLHLCTLLLVLGGKFRPRRTVAAARLAKDLVSFSAEKRNIGGVGADWHRGCGGGRRAGALERLCIEPLLEDLLLHLRLLLSQVLHLRSKLSDPLLVRPTKRVSGSLPSQILGPRLRRRCPESKCPAIRLSDKLLLVKEARSAPLERLIGCIFGIYVPQLPRRKANFVLEAEAILGLQTFSQRFDSASAIFLPLAQRSQARVHLPTQLGYLPRPRADLVDRLTAAVDPILSGPSTRVGNLMLRIRGGRQLPATSASTLSKELIQEGGDTHRSSAAARQDVQVRHQGVTCKWRLPMAIGH